MCGLEYFTKTSIRVVLNKKMGGILIFVWTIPLGNCDQVIDKGLNLSTVQVIFFNLKCQMECFIYPWCSKDADWFVHVQAGWQPIRCILFRRDLQDLRPTNWISWVMFPFVTSSAPVFFPSSHRHATATQGSMRDEYTKVWLSLTSWLQSHPWCCCARARSPRRLRAQQHSERSCCKA